MKPAAADSTINGQLTQWLERTNLRPVDSLVEVMFLDSLKSQERLVYAFGCNEFAESLAVHLDLAGVIDDVSVNDSFCGLPVIRSDSISSSALIICCVVGVKPAGVISDMRSKGHLCLDYIRFRQVSELPLKPVWDLHHGPLDFVTNFDSYLSLYSEILEPESKECLARLVAFRATGNLQYLSCYRDRRDVQYFESFCALENRKPIFWDVGGFDGETSELYLHAMNHKAVAHIFEPIQAQCDFISRRFGDSDSVEVHHIAASDREEPVHVHSDGSASRIVPDGSEIVTACRLDDLDLNPPGFIKLDIEGAELKALDGMSKTIRAHTPLLAVAVYHKVTDLLSICDLVLSFNHAYELRLRHYTEGFTETILFFLPKTEQ